MNSSHPLRSNTPFHSFASSNLLLSSKNWWERKPDLFEPIAFGRTPSLPTHLTLDAQVSPTTPSRFEQLGTRLQIAWEKGTLIFLANLSLPSVVIGLVLGLVGVGGLLAAVTGIQTPWLAFISHHLPESIIISLTLVRAGIHTIAKGVRLSRRYQRFRLEAQEKNLVFRIRQHLDIPIDRPHELREVERFNERLPAWLRLENPLSKGYPHSNMGEDMRTTSGASYLYRLSVLQALQMTPSAKELLSELPVLEKPLAVTGSLSAQIEELDTTAPAEQPCLSQFLEKWHTWWDARIPALGALDIAVGQIMLFCAIGSILIMALHTHHLPAIFQLLANDPGLSLTFTFILLSHWVSCTWTGWRMLNWHRREERRNSNIVDLQLIDLGMERMHVQDFHCWLNRRLDQIQVYADEEVAQVRKAINESYQFYLSHLPDLQEKITEAHRLRASSKAHSDNCLVYGFHELGKKIVPSLSTPSFLVGSTIILLGAALLVMSVTHHVPSQLAFLAKNTPLSALISSGFIISGVFAVATGVVMGERKKREEWKNASHYYREQFLENLFPELEHPSRPKKTRSKRTLPPHLELNLAASPRVTPETRKQIASHSGALANKWLGCWKHSLRALWLPDLVLGSFLLFSSIAGIAICLGFPATSSLQFIAADPKLSFIFCIGVATIGIDALITSWRIGSYHWRESSQSKNLEKIEKCYARFKETRIPPDLV